MPMPSSRDAPRFTGKNLREFLADYEIGTSEAGWTDKKKCSQIPLYCRQSIQHLVSTLEEQLAKYYQEYKTQVEYLKPKGSLSEADQNLYFWKGLPKHLQKDVFDALKAENPQLNHSSAESIEKVKGMATKVLDKESIYLRITHTGANKKKSDESDSDDELSYSKSHKSSKHHHHKEDSDSDSSSSTNHEFEDSSSESDSDSEDDHRWSCHKQSAKRKEKWKSHRETSLPRTKAAPSKSADSRVDDLAEELWRLSLKLN
ncbi:hypothetical protein BS47DRAFT_1368609 [Hydnum rufescens UP504]|uniref:Uncharacterized protein n=1 Tax=Hydnum rufescens UP504 TaxID=1448309 RepID=A0A9P6DNJ2_9AGAM|nr:hypothetical protein BS47DRAFT_1368609 [Hydnum rufescens UP504]